MQTYTVSQKKHLPFSSLDSKVDGANMGPNRVLSAPGGHHVGPINLAIRENIILNCYFTQHREHHPNRRMSCDDLFIDWIYNYMLLF